MYERSVSVVSEQEEAEGCAHKHSNNFQGETNKTINTFRYTSPTITQDETGQWLLRKYTLWLMLVKIEGWWSESQPISFILKYLQTGSIPSTVYWAAGMCAHRLAPLWAPQPNCQQASAQPSQHSRQGRCANPPNNFSTPWMNNTKKTQQPPVIFQWTDSHSPLQRRQGWTINLTNGRWRKQTEYNRGTWNR